MKYSQMVLLAFATLYLASAANAQDQAVTLAPERQATQIRLEEPAALDIFRDGKFPNYIKQKSTSIELNTGIISKNKTILSIPFQYKNVIRLKNRFKTNGRDVLPGAIGFDAGIISVKVFRGKSIRDYEPIERPAFCFFDTNSAYVYSFPVCFSETNILFLDRIGLENQNNLPLSVLQGGFVWGKPEFEKLDNPIDHNFHLDLVIDNWDELGPHMHWRSDNTEVASLQPSTDDEGRVVLELSTGLITLTASPSDPSSTRVTFTSRANAKPVSH